MKAALECIGYAGCVGMALTGWWAFDNETAFAVSAVMAAPHSINVFRNCMKGGAA